MVDMSRVLDHYNRAERQCCAQITPSCSPRLVVVQLPSHPCRRPRAVCPAPPLSTRMCSPISARPLIQSAVVCSLHTGAGRLCACGLRYLVAAAHVLRCTRHSLFMSAVCVIHDDSGRDSGTPKKGVLPFRRIQTLEFEHIRPDGIRRNGGTAKKMTEGVFLDLMKNKFVVCFLVRTSELRLLLFVKCSFANFIVRCFQTVVMFVCFVSAGRL